jgi:DNA-binding NarL/FixJ family response regulator
MNARIFSVDDFESVRDGAKLAFQCQPEWQVVREAAGGQPALESAAQHKPELVFMHTELPDFTGLEVCDRLLALASPL